MKYNFNHYSNKDKHLKDISLDDVIKKLKNTPNITYNVPNNGGYDLMRYTYSCYPNGHYETKVILSSEKPIKKYVELCNKCENNKIFHDKFPQIEYYDNYDNIFFVDYIEVNIFKKGNLYNSVYSGVVYDYNIYRKNFINKESCNIVNNDFKKMLKCSIISELDGGYNIYRCEKTKQYGVIDCDMNIYFEASYSGKDLDMLKKDFNNQYCLECNMKKIYEE